MGYVMRQVVVAAIVAGLVAFGVGRYVAPAAGAGGALVAKESAYERVMRTGVIRCGYYMFKPMSWKDPVTGEMRGMVVDVATLLEAQSGIRMEWTEEVTFTTMIAGLESGRYDALCTPTWPDGRVSRVADLGRTWFYSAIIPIVRGDEQRLRTVSDINHPDVTIATHEGDPDETLARIMFPRAKQVKVAPGADTSNMDMDLMSGKADVILSDMNRIVQFNTHNPGKMKALSTEPLQLFPLKMAVRRGDEQLTRFLDDNILYMQHGPFMQQVIDTHAAAAGMYVPVGRD